MAKKPFNSPSPRRIKTLKQVEPHERNNSNSLRTLLFDVIERDYDGSTRDAAQRFRQLLKQSRDRRKFRMHGKGLSPWSLSRVCDDDTPITFAQLDALAHHVEMPMGLVLLFSRIRSEVESARGDITDARKILLAAKAALNRLEKSLGPGDAPIANVYEHLSHDEFEAMRAAYAAELEKLRRTLL